MTEYKLHGFCQSGNTYKVALYLQCAGLDWEPVFVDFFNGQTRDPKWRETVNEMGEVPVLEHVLEHGATKLAQSGVILHYLVDKTGKFAPTGEAQRLEALRWVLFDNHKFTSYFATYRFMKAFLPQEPDAAVMAFLKGRFDSALKIVEQHLGTSRFIAGDTPTIADFSLMGYMFFPPEESGYDWSKTNPNLTAWLDRIRALPGWKGPYDLLPGERIKPLR
jgi:glutathione S-transferase